MAFSVRREREHLVQKPRTVACQLHQNGAAPDCLCNSRYSQPAAFDLQHAVAESSIRQSGRQLLPTHTVSFRALIQFLPRFGDHVFY